MCVHITSPPSAKPLIAEPLLDPLPGGLVLIPTLTGEQRELRHVRVVNLSHSDVVLRPGTRIAVLVEAEEIGSEDLKFVSQQGSNAVYVERVSASESRTTQTPFPCPDFDGTACQRRKIRNLLEKHRKVFSRSDEELGYTDLVEHQIHTKDEIPLAQPYRSIPPPQLSEVKRHIQDLLNKGIIKESHSPYAAPIVIVRKRDGTIRLCVDYRRLNTKTVRDAYPLPRLLESFDSLSGAQYFSTLDLASGYHQIAMDPAHQH